MANSGSMMNSYQKFAVFLIRVTGVVVAVRAIVGPVQVGLLRLLGVRGYDYPTERWLASLFWGVGGIVLVLLAKPIGRFLGRGLE